MREGRSVQEELLVLRELMCAVAGQLGALSDGLPGPEQGVCRIARAEALSLADTIDDISRAVSRGPERATAGAEPASGAASRGRGIVATLPLAQKRAS